MKFLRFCAKNSKYCDFLPFLIGISQKQQYSQRFCLFSFPLPIAGKNGIGFLQSKEQKKVNKQANVRYQFTFAFLFWKFVQRKEKFIFFEQFSWFLAKITFFETWNIFFESAFHIFQKQFAIHLAWPTMKLFQTQIKKSLFLNNQIGVKFAVSSQFAVLY